MASKSFQVSIDFIGNVSDLQSKIRQVTGDINKIGATSGGGAVQKQFDQLSKAVTDLHTRLNQPIKTQGDFNKLVSEAQKIELGYNNLIQTIQRLQGAADAKKLELLPADQQNRIKQAEQAIDNYEKTVNRAGGSLKKFQQLQSDLATQKGIQTTATQELDKYQTELQDTINKIKELQTLQSEVKSLQGKRNYAFQQASKARESGDLDKANSFSSQVATYNAQLDVAQTKLQQLKQTSGEIKPLQLLQGNLEAKITKASTEANIAAENIKRITEEMNNLGGDNTQALQTAFDNLKQKAAELKVNLEGIGKDATAANVEELTSRLRMLKGEGLEQADAAIIKMANDLESKLGGALQKNRSHIEQTTQAWGQFMSAQEDMSMLQNRLKYFFSLTNSIQLLKRTITSAMNTVKELDAVMTETAVVTDFTVGDMWDKLPEYANKASALGASIKDLYSATTLYYQQGLNSSQAMNVGIETMKMARIANLEAGDATQHMTAALRGFNMEINETSAQRVNDVYSELAAITAADTAQIATAMSKTASIANAANMEFETTSALLAQIIETTQEAPETAGTAMKTIIARFTEVKKLFDEGMLSGEDAEGEAIEINKIDAALRTVGISLTDFLKGKKGIDDIFLELASKWDTLDLATQRYIATTAAGSRQQSRFIAMMSNYDRTMELVTAANNSAGASQEQFDKTLDSMEAKLQKLKNAWDEFTMGLANNEILKGGIDLLTGLLETINKLTDALSGGSGLGKSIINFMAVIGALKGGKALLSGGFSFIGKSMGLPGKQQTQIDTDTFGGSLKAGQINAVQMITGSKSQQQGVIEGQKAAQGYQQGFIGGLKSKMAQSSYEVIGQNFWGNKIQLSAYSKVNSIDYLAQAFEQNPEILQADTDVAKNFVNTVNTKGIEAANQELEKMGGNIQGLVPNFQALQVNFQSIGMAAMGAGTAISLLSGLFEKMGMEEAAELAKGLGGALLGIGSVLTMLGPMMNSLGIAVNATGISFLKAGAAGAASGTATAIAWGSVLWPLLAVAAALGAIVAIGKIAYKNSPEGMLKSAEESAERAEERVKTLTEEYENLNSNIESLESKTQSLNDLTEGTDEWKKSISELNSEVLKLVETYPELAELLKYNDKGVLTLDGKTVSGKTKEDIVGEYENKVTNAQIGKYSADANVAIKKADKIMTTGLAAGGAGYLTANFQNQYLAEKFAKEVALGEIFDQDNNFTQEAIDEYGEERLKVLLLNEEGNINSDNLNNISKIGAQLIGLENQYSANANEIARAAQNNANIENAEYLTFLSSKQQTENLRQKIEDQDNYISRKEGEKYAEDYGYYYANKKFYTDKSMSEEVEVAKEDIKSHFAGKESATEMEDSYKALDDFIGQIKNSKDISDEAFKSLTAENEGRALNKEQIDKLSTEGYAEEYWNTNKAQLEKIYGENGFKTFKTFVESQVGFADQAYEEADIKLQNMRISLKENSKLSDLDSGTYSNIIDNIWEVSLSSGNKKAEEAVSEIEAVMNEIKDPEAAQKFAQAIGDLDWTNIKDIENLSNDLEDLGIAALFGEGDIDVLERKIISLAKAVRAFDAEEMKEAFGASRDLAEDIRNRDKDDKDYKNFTEEQMKQLIESDSAKAGDFVWTGDDQFTYIGSSMDALAGALDRNTAAQLKEYKEGLEQKAQAAEKWNETVANQGEDWENYTNFYEGVFSAAAAGNLKISKEGTYFTDTSTGQQYNLGEQNLANYREAAVNFGMADAETAASLGIEQLIDLFALKFDELGSEAARQSAIEGFAKFMEQYVATSAYIQSPTQIYSGMQAGNISMEEGQKALQAQMSTSGVSQEEAEVLTEALLKEDAAFEGATEAGQVHALQLDQIKQKNKEAAESTSEYLEEYKQLKGVGKQADAALKKTAKAIEKAFGVEPDTDWIKENQKDIEDWADGNEEAGERIAKSLKKNYSQKMIQSLKDTGVQIGANNSLFDAYAQAILNLPSEAHVSADFDGTALANGITASEEQIAAFSAAIAAMRGISITWTSSLAGVADDGTPLYNWFMNSSVGNGAGHTGGGGNGGGGGGGGGEEWENPYDKLYNVTEKINKSIREREQLERRYQRLIDRRMATAAELQQNSQAEIKSLKEQAKLQQQMIDGRREMMEEEMEENSELQKYATINTETGLITIDWELIDSVTDEEEGSEIEEYISKLEELRDSMHEAQDALEEIEDSVWEIEERGREEYLEFEDRIKEALIEVRQKEIDTLEEINESINDTNDKLLDSIQQSIDKMRQDRENERTEEDLQEKQRRLAYLEQDTSNANAMEILELRKEIEEGQEDYTDTLIDQKISELQEQNDKAAEQREKQITLLQNQLDWEIESGRIWQVVEALMQDGLDPQGGLIRGSMLEQILRDGEQWIGLSDIGQMNWLLDLETMIAESMNWRMTKGQLENLHEKKTDQEIEFINSKGEKLTGTVDEKGQVWTGKDTYYKDVYQWIDGTYHTTESEATKYVAPKPEESKTSTGSSKKKGSGKTYPYQAIVDGVPLKGSYSTPEEAAAAVAKAIETNGGKGSGEVTNYTSGETKGRVVEVEGEYFTDISGEIEKIKKYKTGGLADFTGPAWLDGTKSRPELVLNQRDTQNFIQLKDILSSIMTRNFSSAQTPTENNGDITYDIDINVETMGSDYDVEQVANKVKSMINEDARYRNNNAISLKR